MKNSKSKSGNQLDGSNRFNNSSSKIKKTKNSQRFRGGGGLSLEAFASAKTKSMRYNPSEIKKNKEFYKNAKYLKKFKKQVKQGNQQDDENEPEDDSKKISKGDQKIKKGSYSLEAVYSKKHEEVEKERLEREVIINARNEERGKAEARRKDLREKMLKKTKKGQPVMKYRIQHLLETIQRSAT